MEDGRQRSALHDRSQSPQRKNEVDLLNHAFRISRGTHLPTAWTCSQDEKKKVHNFTTEKFRSFSHDHLIVSMTVDDLEHEILLLHGWILRITVISPATIYS